MRCKICDAIMTDKEAVAKDHNGNYWDMCEMCLCPWEEPDIDSISELGDPQLEEFEDSYHKEE